MTGTGEFSKAQQGNLEKKYRRAGLSLLAAGLVCASALSIEPINTAEASVPSCNKQSSYAYAGMIGSKTVNAVSAEITEISYPEVKDGHVAAWIGVGGAGMGPNGEDEWLQAGIANSLRYKSIPVLNNKVYYEFKSGDKYQIEPLGPARVGVPVSLKLEELKSNPGHWVIYVNNHRRGPLVTLPGSHNAYRAIVTAENWGGDSKQCNNFNFEFNNVEVSGPSSVRSHTLNNPSRMKDTGYKLTNVKPSGFIAASTNTHKR